MELVGKAFIGAAVFMVVVIGVVFPYNTYASSDVGVSFGNLVQGASQLLDSATGSISMTSTDAPTAPAPAHPTTVQHPKPTQTLKTNTAPTTSSTTPVVPPSTSNPIPYTTIQVPLANPTPATPATSNKPVITKEPQVTTVPPSNNASTDLKLTLITTSVHLSPASTTQVTLSITGSSSTPVHIAASADGKITAQPGRNNLAPPKNINLIISTGDTPNGTYHVTITGTQDATVAKAILTVVVP